MARWKYVSRGARGARVVAQERPDREGIVYLYWSSVAGVRESRSLAHGVRNDRGGLDRALVALAVGAAEAEARRLDAAQPGAAGLTLGETEALVFHPLDGKYPLAAGQRATLHQREVRRALRYAVGYWGEGRAWATLTRRDVRMLWRVRLQELHKARFRGVRGAEVLVARVLAIARWLQDQERLAPDVVLASRRWKQELHDDWRQITGSERNYEPDRPRYTEDEFRAILRVAPEVDPRFALLVELCAEQRLQGAARRLMRSDVSDARLALQLPSSGRKQGALVLLTDEQGRALGAALDRGYLAVLERARDLGTITDYPLFPQRRLPADGIFRLGAATRKPISREAVGNWFLRAERLAGIPHRPGRGTKGLRRTGVDMAVSAGATPAELEAYGGWSDSQMPQAIYRTQQHRAAAEGARTIRQKARTGK